MVPVLNNIGTNVACVGVRNSPEVPSTSIDILEP